MGTDEADRTSISEREAEARIEKLHLEQEVLRQQCSPSHRFQEKVRAYTGLAAILSAFVAFGGLLLTFWQASENFRIAEAGRTAERFERALAFLSSDSAAQRVSGIRALNSFYNNWDSPYAHRSLVSIASLMALEKDVVVLSAMHNVFAGLRDENVPISIKRDVHEVLIDGNRSIFLQHPELAKVKIKYIGYDRVFNNCGDFANSNSKTQLCDTRKTLSYLGASIVELVAAGSDVLDLSQIYCPYCNFSNLSIGGASFKEAYLVEADFSEADLDEASFRDAFLVGTKFRGASLRGANYTVSFNSYVLKNFENHLGKEAVYGPDFNSAILDGADFSGHPVFRFHSAKQQDFFADLGPIFHNASLTGADFTKIRVYAVTDDERAPLENNFWSHPIHLPNGFFFVEWPLAPDAKLRMEADSPYLPYLQLRSFMQGANWEEASFPEGIEALLKHYPENAKALFEP